MPISDILQQSAPSIQDAAVRRPGRRVAAVLRQLPSYVSGEGAIDYKYRMLGGEPALGAVTSKEAGRIWQLAGGSCIVYNKDFFEAFHIAGPIYRKWLALGGMRWGIPCTDQLGTPDRVGRYNHFNDNSASIYWTPETGACAIWGAIRQKWAALGWEQSVAGYPVTDELGTPDGIGRYNHFANGASIYWTPATGPALVYGDIRGRWASLGWEQSYLGYPISDETDFPEGGRANGFQYGGIYWWPDTGAIDLGDVAVHYTGLHCFHDTEGPGADEPYAIISVSGPLVAATFQSRIYEGVDGRESQPDLIEIYRGKPFGISIGTVVMEHDFGNPDAYKQQVQDIVMGVHKAGTEALRQIPAVGPAIAAIAGPVLGALMPSIGGAISDLFDWGDNRIGSGIVTLSARQMVLLAARTANATIGGVGFKAESPLIEGLGASYKAYFGLVPA